VLPAESEASEALVAPMTQAWVAEADRTRNAPRRAVSQMVKLIVSGVTVHQIAVEYKALCAAISRAGLEHLVSHVHHPRDAHHASGGHRVGVLGVLTSWQS
jgi:hypothetical protein